ncbi:MAG: alpha-1,2-fucosyltransferase [Lachnospiraceae bacterium]|nr:alpha-1,2-fucosyltransferase [Lachnospiraceae bacterium]
MIMLQMSGGLGNQMFFYALYKELQKEGKDVCIEDFTHYEDIGRKDKCLEEIFELTYEKADRKVYERITDSSMQPWKRLRRKLLGRKGKVYKEKDAITFEPEIFVQTDCYAEGYWQSQRYFEKVQDELRKDFDFDWEKFPAKAKEYRKQMEQTTSVSLHIRRGDYLNDKFAPIYGGICTDAYYEGAKAYLQKKYPDCVFYLFTNDPEWGRSQEGDNVVFVDCTGPDNAYVDMALMSCCKHHIIANSSFSWWGAWLNISKDKTVIAPAKWLNTSEGQDIYSGLCNVKVDATGVVTEENIR